MADDDILARSEVVLDRYKNSGLARFLGERLTGAYDGINDVWFSTREMRSDETTVTGLIHSGGSDEDTETEWEFTATLRPRRGHEEDGA